MASVANLPFISFTTVANFSLSTITLIVISCLPPTAAEFPLSPAAVFFADAAVEDVMAAPYVPLSTPIPKVLPTAVMAPFTAFMGLIIDIAASAILKKASPILTRPSKNDEANGFLNKA
jgi:hypothetical protein